MAGINRLGKAPPKPGTLRPPDPNKYRTVDMFSEGAEGDMDYIKTVRDIEEMQQQQGWLFGRGAFDKADLLYLRDTMEQQRHMELELRDNERSQFASLRARLDKEHDDQRTTGSTTTATRSAKRDREPTVKVHPKAKPLVVAKKGHDKAAECAVPAAAGPLHLGAAGTDKRRRVGQEEQMQQPGVEHHTAGNTGQPSTSTSLHPSDEGGALEGLLGGYGSDSDASTGGEDSSAAAGSGLHLNGGLNQAAAAAAVVLPSASELLDTSKPVDSTLPKPQVVERGLVWTLPETDELSTSD